MANVSKIQVGNQLLDIHDANLAKTALQYDSASDAGQNVIESVLINGERYTLGGGGGGAGPTLVLSVEFPRDSDSGRISMLNSQLPEGLYFIDVHFNNQTSGVMSSSPSYGTTIYIRNNNIQGTDDGTDNYGFPAIRSALFGTTGSYNTTTFDMLYIQYVLDNRDQTYMKVDECLPIVSLRYSNGDVYACDWETDITANFYKLN